MKTLTIEEFHAQIREQGMKDNSDVAFVCPMCRTAQSARSLIKAGAGSTFDEVERFLGFSCVGRWTGAGPHKIFAQPGKGCDWTLGGLLQVHEVEVVTPDGKHHPQFALATAEEAAELARSPVDAEASQS